MIAGNTPSRGQLSTRILPPEEWPTLAGTLLDPAWRSFDPEGTRVVVVQDHDGAVLGCLALFPIWHLEGAWIAPAHRGKAAVARALLARMRHQCRQLGVSDVWVMATNPKTRRICERLGTSTHLDCDHFSVRLPHESV
jgi:RimJ/RimL family protein N-acetyltransferase